MRRLYPATSHLRAFVITARHGSVSRAAEELHLTQSAVSKQILELEDQLGTALFIRERKRLSISPAGQAYLARVAPLLAQLEAATLEMMAHGARGGGLHVSTLPTFGAKWLIPKLPQFAAAHPEVSLQFVPFSRGYDFSLPELDCAIRFGDGAWSQATADYLVGRQITLIAPRRAKGMQPLRKPAEVAQHTLLQHVSAPGEWGRWCAGLGVQHSAPNKGPVLDQYTSLIRAVMAGMGLALVPHCLVAEDIEAGLVSAPFARAAAFESRFGYYLCYPPERAQVPALAAFRAWILEACRNDIKA